MRTYPPNSPAARARLLALAMVIDGDLDPAELEVLGDPAVLNALEVDKGLFRQVLSELCTDMLRTAVRDGAVELTPELLDGLLADITDAQLQHRLLATMVRIVDADAYVAEAEGMLLERACACWKPDLARLKESVA